MFDFSETKLSDKITAINKAKVENNFRDFSDDEEEDGSAEKDMKKADSLGTSNSGGEETININKET